MVKERALPFGEVTCGVLALVGAVKRDLFSKRFEFEIQAGSRLSLDAAGEVGYEDMV
jgi:hypothetical protein